MDITKTSRKREGTLPFPNTTLATIDGSTPHTVAQLQLEFNIINHKQTYDNQHRAQGRKR